MTSTSAPTGIGRTVFADQQHELANTRRVLERVPDEHLDWRPHEKSSTLGQIASHIATLPFFQFVALEKDELDVATFSGPQQFASRDEMLAKFDEVSARALDAVAQATEEQLQQPWTLRFGDRVIFTMPRAQVIRVLGLNHIMHHRAQLTVYLRLLDVPVPGLYGPSADEPTI